jgi:hypothetical protein
MSTAGDGQPDSPEALRAEIDETREQLGDTVEALAAKTDVKARAEDRVEGIKQDARAKADQVKEKVTSVTPESARQGGGELVAKAKANPLPIAGAAALLLAFAIGRRSARP